MQSKLSPQDVVNNYNLIFSLDHFMRNQGIDLTDAELVVIFRRADVRNLGVINLLEFKKYLLFHMSSLVETAKHPEPANYQSSDTLLIHGVTNYKTNPKPRAKLSIKYSISLDSMREKYGLPPTGASKYVNLLDREPGKDSEFKTKKETSRPYFKDHPEYGTCLNSHDIFYDLRYFPHCTFKHFSHELREFPRRERDFPQCVRNFYSAPKKADISTLKPLQVTFPRFDSEEKIYNPVRPANLANITERWKVRKLEDADAVNAEEVLEKPDEHFRKRVAEITVLKASDTL